MRTPKTLPAVPTEDELRVILSSCPETVEGVRNRAMILVLADAGLRASELLHLLVETGGPQIGVCSSVVARAAKIAWRSSARPRPGR